MSVIANNDKLPPEILNEIFKNLAPNDLDYGDLYLYKTEGHPICKSNKDIISCLRVCKSWRIVIKTNFKWNNRIKVNDYMLPYLADNISRFGHTIQSILLITKVHEEYGYYTNLTDWKKVLAACINLETVEISMICGEKLEYLSVLRLREIKLKNIKNIFIKRIEDSPASTSNAYLITLIPFRATITSLYVLYPSQLPVEIQLHGLTSFISKFPNLTKLAIKDTFRTSYNGLNIKELLQAAPNLRELHLYDLSVIKDNFEKDEFENTCLTHLKIEVSTMKLTSLIHLTSSLLNKVNYLYLYIDDLIIDDISEKESNKLLSDFQHSLLLEVNDVYVEIVNINKIIKSNNYVTDSILFESDVDSAETDEDFQEYKYNCPWNDEYSSGEEEGFEEEFEGEFGEGYDDEYNMSYEARLEFEDEYEMFERYEWLAEVLGTHNSFYDDF